MPLAVDEGSGASFRSEGVRGWHRRAARYGYRGPAAVTRKARSSATWHARPGLAEAIREALAVVKMAGDGPKSVLMVLRLPESSTPDHR